MKKDRKNILIGVLLFAIIAMSVGYAAFATTLNINGTANIQGEWDIEITNITSEAVGNASDITPPDYTATTATFDTSLMAPGDSMTYTITVENKGSIDAKLSNIALTPQTQGTDAIIYSVIEKPEKDSILEAGDLATVVIKAEYDPTVTTPQAVKSKTFTGTLEYVQK